MREIESLTVACKGIMQNIYRNIPIHLLPVVAKQRGFDFNPPKTQLQADDKEFERRVKLMTIRMNTPRRRDDTN